MIPFEVLFCINRKFTETNVSQLKVSLPCHSSPHSSKHILQKKSTCICRWIANKKKEFILQMLPWNSGLFWSFLLHWPSTKPPSFESTPHQKQSRLRYIVAWEGGRSKPSSTGGFSLSYFLFRNYWASELHDAKDTLPETHICQDGQSAIGEFLTNRGNLRVPPPGIRDFFSGSWWLIHR